MKTKKYWLLILPLLLSSCSTDEYDYKFAPYYPSDPDDPLIAIYDGIGLNVLASGVGKPKSDKIDKNNNYIIKTFVGKDEREDPSNQNYIGQIDIVLFADNIELDRKIVDGETYNKSVIKQKDSYKKFLSFIPILPTIIYFSDATIFSIPFSMRYKYKKSDFKIENDFNLKSLFFENYEGTLFIEFYQRTGTGLLRNEITQYSWDVVYDARKSTISLTNFHYNSRVTIKDCHDLTVQKKT